MKQAFVDNDVLHKTATYGLLYALVGSSPLGVQKFGVLGAAKYVVIKKLTKKPPQRGAELAIQELKEVFAEIAELEPTSEEVQMAANLEYAAHELDLEFDGGESLLCAMLLQRGADYLFTGDKRAISAMATFISKQLTAGLAGRVVCLEQLFMHLICAIDPSTVRQAICAEPLADKTLANCFACRSTNSTLESWAEGLSSYISDLTSKAPGALVAIKVSF